MKSIEVLGAPVDLGADRRGVDMGASAIRYAGLLDEMQSMQLSVVDAGNLPLLLPHGVDAGSPSAKYLPEIVSMSRAICDSVKEIEARQRFPLILGGDHSVSLGSVAGVAASGPCGLIWMDAHGDFNTPATTPSGNVHGMVLAALAGFGDERLTSISGHSPVLATECIALLGVRELDPEERKLLGRSGIHIFTMSDIDRQGMARVIDEALLRVSRAASTIHLSLDLDVVDPLTAPGVGTPVPGGLSYREAQLAMETVASSGLLRSMDVVEVNPILDTHSQTAILAVELVLSALGKRIL